MPLTQRWHEFRLVYLPALTCLILFAAALFIWKHYVTPKAMVAPDTMETANVVTDAAKTGPQTVASETSFTAAVGRP